MKFTQVRSDKELWDRCNKVADKISELFPNPIKLEFEDVIYKRFFILTKKRYMYTSCKEDKITKQLTYSDKVGKKGVLLARRDNSQFIRDIYESVVTMVFERKGKEEVINFIIEEINKLCSRSIPYKNFVVTKALGSCGNLTAVPFINEKGKKKGKVGDYTVPLLSDNPKERQEQMAKKEASSVEEYYLLCLPAQVQLAERMRKRGQRVEAGSRMEYVITENGGHTAKQYEKVESSEYYAQHSDILRLDYMYYLKLLSNPMDQVLEVAFKEKNFVLNQYKYRLRVRTKVLDELLDLFKPKIRYVK